MCLCLCFNIILLAFGCAGSFLLCVGFLWLWPVGATPWLWASHCGGFSFAEHALQGVGFSSCVHGFSCPSACGIFQGLNTCSLNCRRILKLLDNQEVPPSNIFMEKETETQWYWVIRPRSHNNEQSSKRNLGQSGISKSNLYNFLAKQLSFVN